MTIHNEQEANEAIAAVVEWLATVPSNWDMAKDIAGELLEGVGMEDRPSRCIWCGG